MYAHPTQGKEEIVLGNTPRQATNLFLERGKSYALDLKFVDPNKQPFDITDAVVRIVVEQPARFGGAEVIQKTATVLDAAAGHVQFPFQANELYLDEGEYPYDITYVTANDYSVPVTKGVVSIGMNTDDDTTNTYTTIDSTTGLLVTLAGGRSIDVCLQYPEGVPGVQGDPGPPGPLSGVFAQDDPPAVGATPPETGLWVDTDEDAPGSVDPAHEHDADYVNVTGDTMTGDLLVPNIGVNNPISNARVHIATSANTEYGLIINRAAAALAQDDPEIFMVQYLGNRATWTNEKGNLRTSTVNTDSPEDAFKIIVPTGFVNSGNSISIVQEDGSDVWRVGVAGRVNYYYGSRLVGDTIQFRDSTQADESSIGQTTGGDLEITPKNGVTINGDLSADNMTGIVSLADGDAVPPGTPAGTVIVRTEA